MVIEATDVHMRYGDVHALAGVDIEVGRAELVAVLGPNGAGKTTLVSILHGSRRPTAGRVTVLGLDPGRDAPALRARIGVVLQSCEAEPYLSVAELVDLYRGYYPHPRARDELLELVGLADAARARVRTLSGGQRRRLDVALALVGDPEVLFLDEPTTGFDPEARRAAWRTVEQLRAAGTTVVLTTHYLEEAEVLADRIVVLSRGRVVADGPAATIGGSARQRVCISFAPPLGAVAGDLGIPVEAAAAEWSVTVAAGELTTTLHRVTSWAIDRGVELDGLRVTRSTLEDAYLDLIALSSTPALTLHQFRFEQRIFWRTPATVAFGFAMPVVLLVIFATINESTPMSDEPEDFAQTFVPGMIAFGVASACYGNLVARFVYRRESGLLLRVRSTPLPVAALVGGFVANAVVVAVLVAAASLGSGVVLYDVTIGGQWWALVAGLGVGAVSFCAIGLAVASFVPDIDAADPVVFGSLLPVAFVSGVFMDVDTTSVLGQIGALFPVRHLLDVFDMAFDPDAGVTDPVGPLLVVAVWGVAAAVVAVRRFRWEPSHR